jgi:hypothetical protein
MSRTYRDGGLDGKWAKFERKYSSRRQRMLEREYCQKSKINDDTDSFDVEQRPSLWGKGWTGYWRPMRRWLESHIGEPWNQVYSELIAKLKRYTSTNDELSIRHYVTNFVEITPDPRFGNEKYSWFKWAFYVDDFGNLQKKPTIRNRAYYTYNSKFDTSKLVNWLNGRIVGYQGNQLYWFVPVCKNKKHGRVNSSIKWKCEWSNGYTGKGINYHFGLNYLYLYYKAVHDPITKEIINNQSVWERAAYFSSRLNARQDEPLTKADIDFWNKLPEFYKKEVLEWSPTNPEPKKLQYY